MPDTFAGYRLVRKLGAGSRSETFLGVATGDGTAPSRPVALKVYRQEVTRSDVGRELAVLGSMDLAHCVRLLDVATAADGMPVPILTRVQRGSLAQLLRDRESIEVGEAVTLLAPLPETLGALHALGIAHAKLSASALHFGAAGEPVLLGFGHACSFDAGLSVAALDDHPAAILDRDGLAALVGTALARVRSDGSAARVNELLAWLANGAGGRSFEFLPELEGRLFDLAEPLPIEFARLSSAPTVVPARIGDPVEARDVPAAPNDPDRARGSLPAPALPARALATWLTETILANPITALRSRALGLARGVRRPIWLAAGTIAVALILALALLPKGAAPRAPATTGGLPTPRSSASPLPADPLQALPLLIAARNRCIRDLSVLCLAAADERSSPALRDDTALIRRIQSGQQIPASAIVTAKAPTLADRLGDSALVSLGAPNGPASVLMIRGEAGWRMRSFLDEKPVRP